MEQHAPEIQILNTAVICILYVGALPWEPCSHITGTLLIWIFPVDAYEQFVLKFCQKMTSVLPL